MRRLNTLAVLIAAVLPASALAQSLQGKVVDSRGRTVAGAEVSIMGTTTKTVTDAEGEFRFDDLENRDIELHFSAAGFAHQNQEVPLSLGDASRLEIVLVRSAFEVIDVTASPFHASNMESASPVSVLSGQKLRNRQAATLGDTLANEIGVHTNFHANVASTPIIRGLSGPRVLITQNSLDVTDASRVGPDHAVATEVSTVQQIEVLRGPATLFYGSGAIGGVVNVVDQRVPTSNETRGEVMAEHDSVNNQNLTAFNVTTGVSNFAVYADGFYRKADDYRVPVAPEREDHDHEHEHDHDHDAADPANFRVENSAEESYGYTLGGSYLLDNGYVGISAGHLSREYGIPGHSHGDGEEEIFADLEQTRVQLLSELTFDNAWIRGVNTRASYTDYQHAEIEYGEVGTIFANDTTELRVDLLHQPLWGWRGGVSVHYKQSDFFAEGSEAFTPSSDTEMFALAIMEEKHVGDVLFQLGFRAERVTIDAGAVRLPTTAVHGDEAHDDHDHDHDHDHAHDDHDHGAEGEGLIRMFSADHTFTPITVSAGLVWDFAEGYNLGVSVSRAQRAPSTAELLSFGPHIGTRTYEVGALFALHEHDGEMELGLTDDVIDLETSNNIDITLRKTQGDFGFVLNAFYNQVDNYYYQDATGLFADDGHNHDHGDSHDHGDAHDHGDSDGHDHEGELPVFLFRSADVILHGFEAQLAWQATDQLNATFFSDYVRARLKDGGDLPRTPPLRFGTSFNYTQDRLTAVLDVTRFMDQDRVAPSETETDGYTMVDASITYSVPFDSTELEFYLRGRNLTDTEARVHTSFLKDIAPRPGRSFALGVRGYF